MDVKNFRLDELRPYEKNPRRNDRAVDAVAKSIETFGFKVPIVIDADNVIVCGHTRYKAAQKLKLKTVPCVVADDLSDEQVKAFRLADNKTAELATWDNAFLIEELEDLTAFDIDMSDFGFDISEVGRRQASWARTEKYCDLKKRIKSYSNGAVIGTTLYEVGNRGIPINEIKENPDNIPLFADNLVDYLIHALGDNLSKGDWCIVTTPRRRHKTGFHFSTEICKSAAQYLRLPFYEDAFSAKNRDRINPEFFMEKNPAESNVIVYDDIVSTGETIRTVRQLLIDAGHVAFIVVGIKNRKVTGADKGGG